MEHGGLRAYLSWAGRQGDESARVAEAVLPETDVDAVRVMTIHGAKGLEFGMVVLSGISTQPRRDFGVRLLWPTKGGWSVKLTKNLQTNDFAEQLPIDEQMDDYERRRLLYVAATRARDHLVLSLHRKEGENKTAAAVFIEHGARRLASPLDTSGGPSTLSRVRPPAVTPPADWEEWRVFVEQARAATRRAAAVSASGLEGTEPSVALGPTDDQVAGLAKGARDVELPPWSKGRYGSAVGSAVHAVLQSVELRTGAGLEGAVAATCLAEDVIGLADVVTALVRSALTSELVQRAAVREHWRESWAAAVQEDGTVLEGIVDLIYREDDGSLVIVDYKTDQVPAEAVTVRAQFYGPQLLAYRQLLEAAGETTASWLLFLNPEASLAQEVRSGGQPVIQDLS